MSNNTQDNNIITLVASVTGAMVALLMMYATVSVMNVHSPQPSTHNIITDVYGE